MNHEAAMILKMQNLLKQRRVENKRFESQIRSIELSERRVLLAYERNRQDFLSLVRTRRQKWWLSDERVRQEYAKRGFFKPSPTTVDVPTTTATIAKSVENRRKSVQTTRPTANKLNMKNNNRTGSDLSSSSSSSLSSELSDDDSNSRLVYLIDRMKRSRSSVAKFSTSSTSKVASTNKISHQPRPSTSTSVRKPEAQTQTGAATTSTGASSIEKETAATSTRSVQRPKTSMTTFRRKSSAVVVREPMTTTSGRRNRVSRRDGGEKKPASEQDEVIDLALLIESFFKNTPQNIEKAIWVGGADEQKQKEAKLKSQIDVERANSKKRDLRYFELVNSLSDNKI